MGVKLGLPSAAFVVATVCVLRPEKAVHVLIEAAALLRSKLPNLHILIVGDGQQRDHLTTLIATRGLSDAITMLGRRTDVGEILSVADVCVNTSIYEGAPLSIMEFMAAGRAIVATAVGGVPEMIEHEQTGLLIEPGQPRQLAAAIERLASDPELRHTLGKNAQRRQVEAYDLERSVRRLECIYEELAPR